MLRGLKIVWHGLRGVPVRATLNFNAIRPQIKRDLRRRFAIEPVIGHLKAEHRMGRNFLAHATVDAINAVLAAAGYNLRRLIRWLSLFLLRILLVLGPIVQFKPA